jgi:hypothetical protein
MEKHEKTWKKRNETFVTHCIKFRIYYIHKMIIKNKQKSFMSIIFLLVVEIIIIKQRINGK